jgi:hypothetical protein
MLEDERAAHVPSPALMAPRKFLDENSNVSKLLLTAALDYSSARCLLLNFLVSGGLAAGAQAIEKFLKAYILLNDPTKKIWSFKHRLTGVLNEVDQLWPRLELSRYSVLTDRFERHYRTRYDPFASGPMVSAEIFELDEFIMFLNDNLPMPLDAKYRTGLYALVTFSLNGGTVTPWEKWIKERNQALALRWPQIEADFLAVLKRLHPNAIAFSK